VIVGFHQFRFMPKDAMVMLDHIIQMLLMRARWIRAQ